VKAATNRPLHDVGIGVAQPAQHAMMRADSTIPAPTRE
jgi:hypothetical protein